MEVAVRILFSPLRAADEQIMDMQDEDIEFYEDQYDQGEMSGEDDEDLPGEFEDDEEEGDGEEEGEEEEFAEEGDDGQVGAGLQPPTLGPPMRAGRERTLIVR